MAHDEAMGTQRTVVRDGLQPLHTAGLRLDGKALPLVGRARLYTCGITPYDVTHLGHASVFVWSDLVVHVMRAAGVEVVSCRNVTDVDDVLTEAASARRRDTSEFALYQEYLFDKDMTALRVSRPAFEPRARLHVVQVQQLAAALLAGDRAYVRDGHVFFRGAAAAAGSGLSRSAALDRSAAYGDDPHDALRDDPFDVPIWRPSTETQPAWPSPWGRGRPGWHAECAAMAMSVLGTGIDILAGGSDLGFPHHAYQCAMVEAATSVAPFARAVMHIGAVRQDGAKMAKSTGNLTLVADLLRDHSPAAIRLLLLDRQWRAEWDYHPDLLEAAAAKLDQLYAAAGRPGGTTAVGEVDAALLRDLDVPGTLAIALDSGGETARRALRLLSLD
jgi:cysteinyl-tRNA synthetase